MTTDPLVSVVMPVFDTPQEWLERAFRSVFEQVCRFPFELVVCDDASTIWNTRRLCQVARSTAGDSRVSLRVISRSVRGGPGIARNTAAEQATGEYLLWLDSDDELAPDALDALVETAIQTGAPLTVSQCHVVERDRTLLRDPTAYIDLSRKYWGTIHDPLVQVVFSIQAQLVRTEVFRKVGGFNPEFKLAEVTEFFQRLVRAVGVDRVAVLEEPAYRYHRHDASYSARNRDAFVRYRDYAILEHARALGLDVVDIDRLGRSLVTGAQHYEVHARTDQGHPQWTDAFGPFQVEDRRSLAMTPPTGIALSDGDADLAN